MSEHNGSPKLIRGIVPVVPTPFTSGDEVDLDALAGLVEFACQSGVPAICLPAYGSEFYKLTETERCTLIDAAVKQAKGRVQVFAQSNHPSSRIASEIARRNEGLGADLISFAIPRQFALAEEDVLRYCEAILQSVSVPVLVQDFNPGGATVGGAFAARLAASFGNFGYLKLEEPLMGPKVAAIRVATGDRIGVLEGWGGMYLLELIPTGIRGAMPGLAMCDLFGRVFDLASSGNLDGAFAIYRSMLPQIVYAMQNMELYHHMEKRLLQARGLLRSSAVREPSLRLEAHVEAHIEALNRLVLAEVERQGLTNQQ
jgi:2-keto-3-deoxy-L-arabinonate dehydratase